MEEGAYLPLTHLVEEASGEVVAGWKDQTTCLQLVVNRAVRFLHGAQLAHVGGGQLVHCAALRNWVTVDSLSHKLKIY